VFELAGTDLPRDYRAPLWDAIRAVLAWLDEAPGAGVHEIKAPLTDQGYLLPRRARLALRVPEARAAEAEALAGRELSVAGRRLSVGAARRRPLAPFPTLNAAFVATAASTELGHQEAVAALLEAAGVPARFICGRMRVVHAGPLELAGASVVLHQLRPEQSLHMQAVGLGGHRHLGCGLFLPHKTISGID
jgi:CRISPR-associated protein Cas6